MPHAAVAVEQTEQRRAGVFPYSQRGRPALRRRTNPMKHAVSLLCLAAGLSIAWLAPDLWVNNNFNVTALTAGKVALFDAPNGNVVGEVTQAEFKGPWPALNATSDGHLQVSVEGRPVWVMAYLVQVDKAGHAGMACSIAPEWARKWSGASCNHS